MDGAARSGLLRRTARCNFDAISSRIALFVLGKSSIGSPAMQRDRRRWLVLFRLKHILDLGKLTLQRA
jgi:hypothetical protein